MGRLPKLRDWRSPGTRCWTPSHGSGITLTGLHGLHVLVGLAAIAGLAIASSRHGARVRPVAWEGVAWYWHFVDAVWVVVFSVVYLGTALG